jgi:hypothetical protein
MKLNCRRLYNRCALTAIMCTSFVNAQSLVLRTETGRPVHEAARMLEDNYGWRISYEDPPYTAREVSRFRSVGLFATEAKCVCCSGTQFSDCCR